MVRLDVAAALLVAMHFGGCVMEAQPPQNVCDEAQLMFQSCNVTVPLLSDGACIGLRESAARCIMDVSGDCEELVELTREPDLCLRTLIEPPDAVAGGDPLFPEHPEPWVPEVGG